ncbi:MAG: golvesin C-terminal-like domain-containing protein [Planctomycetota bacterium]
MISYLHQLLLVIKHESKMVLRSWPFRILSFICFAVACLQMVGMVSLIYFVSADTYLGPMFTARNTTMLVLMNMGGLLLWITVFFTNDIGPRDRRIGISDVVGSRPLSTGQYVTGRVLGLLLPLVCLMALTLALTLVVNKACGFHTAPFREYAPPFLSFGVLAVAFTAALTACFSTLMKNRLLASLSTLGLILLTSIWLAQKHDVFDIGGYVVSGNYSDLIGYGPVGPLLIHRSIYLCATLFLVSAAILLYPRPQTAGSRKSAAIASALLLAAAATLAARFVLHGRHNNAVQQEWRETLRVATANTAAAVDRYDIDLDLTARGGRVHAGVATTLRNRDETDRSTFIFMLNPGLHIDAVSTSDGRPVTVERKGPLVELTLDAPLPPGQSVPLVWQYGGKLDPRAAWLVEKPLAEELKERNIQGMAAIMMGQLSGWVGSRFCFFLPESHWYPLPNSTYGYDYPQKRPANFATAQVSLTMPAGWTAATQGLLVDEKTDGDRTTLVFETDTPVPQLSLCAGEYTKVEAEIDGIVCRFYYAPEHSENVEFFADAADELKRVVSESIEQIADELGLEYPYKSLSLVEVPASCRSFTDSWDSRNLLVQPGALLLKETDFFNAYFAQTYKRSRESTKRQGTGATDAQIKAELLKRYFARNVFGGDLELSLVPNYWEFQVDSTGSAYPVLGSGFTAALSDMALGRYQRDGGHAMQRLAQPAGSVNVKDDEVNIGMGAKFLQPDLDQEELLVPLGKLSPSEQEEKFLMLMNRKTKGFVRTLAMVMGEKRWAEFISAVLDKHRFKQIELADMEREATDHSDEDVSWIFEQFVTEPVMPGYVITRADAYEIDAGQRERQFQTVVRVANLEEGKGYILLGFDTEESQKYQGADWLTRVPKKEVLFDSREEKEIRMVLSEKPVNAWLHSVSSRNVDVPIEQLYVPEESRNVPGEDSVRSLPLAERELAVIVDDLDEGFSTVELGKKSRTRLADAKRKKGIEEYPEYSLWSWPRRWHNQTSTEAYGKYLATRKVKRNGDGSHLAVWSASLPQDGTYEVFIYTEPEERGRHKIMVDASEGSQEISLELKTARRGWTSLGKYRFKADATARVELSDEVEESGGKSVLIHADAVKWVYQGPANAVQ